MLATDKPPPNPYNRGGKMPHREVHRNVQPHHTQPATNPRDEVRRQAALHGVPEHVALGVAMSLSGLDQSTRKGDRVGIFLIHPEHTPVMLDAANWRDNIYLGVQQLRALWDRHKDWGTAVNTYVSHVSGDYDMTPPPWVQPIVPGAKYDHPIETKRTVTMPQVDEYETPVYPQVGSA